LPAAETPPDERRSLRNGIVAYPSYWQYFPGALEKAIFQSSILKASDGHELNVYAAGRAGKETVVIASPPTIPFLLMSKLGASLSRHYRVLAWETRGAPYLDAESDGCSLSVERHAKDLSEILQSSGSSGPAHYIGWCGGSWIICWAILRMNLPALSISFIAPNNVDGGVEQTNFQKFITPIVKRVLKARPEELVSICKVLQEKKRETPDRHPSERDIDQVADLNTGTASSLRKWAKAISDFGVLPESTGGPIAGERAISMFDELCTKARTLLMHCRDDDITSYKCSLMASERNPDCKLVLYPTGGHSVAYLHEPVVVRDVMNFICPGYGLPG